jgi:hypothetical protein
LIRIFYILGCIYASSAWLVAYLVDPNVLKITHYYFLGLLPYLLSAVFPYPASQLPPPQFEEPSLILVLLSTFSLLIMAVDILVTLNQHEFSTYQEYRRVTTQSRSGLQVFLKGICEAVYCLALIYLWNTKEVKRSNLASGYLVVVAFITLVVFGSRALVLYALVAAFVALCLGQIQVSRRFFATAVLLFCSVIFLVGILRNIEFEIGVLHSFFVGPILFSHELDTLNSILERNHGYIHPLFATLSGPLTLVDIAARAVEVVYWSFNDVFYTLNDWVFIESLGKEFNSYYTASIIIFVDHIYGFLFIFLFAQLPFMCKSPISLRLAIFSNISFIFLYPIFNFYNNALFLFIFLAIFLLELFRVFERPSAARWRRRRLADDG